MGLKEYQAKRDFTQTREPSGQNRLSAKRAGAIFVVQKHAATRLHYDFRLEMEGVLKSWAVPKGFPTRKGERHLAVEVEDHPLDYGDFEGTIPEGNYGAGTVMVWDAGTYEVGGGDALRALREGKLHLFLSGKKLRGEWALIRLRRTEATDKPQWLLLKSGEDAPQFSRAQETKSVLTGRTLEQIGRENDRQWQSDRASRAGGKLSRLERLRSGNHGSNGSARPAASEESQVPVEATPERRRRSGSLRSKVAAELADLPRLNARFVEPMKAELADELPSGGAWTYEIKFDGVRALAIKKGEALDLLSRAEKPLDAKYPEIAAALGKLPAKEALLDGEVVALDAAGRSDFQLLQSYQHLGGSKPPLVYYVFDLIGLEGRDVRGLPIERRKALAERLVAGLGPGIRFSPSLEAEPAALVREMRQRGLEGLVAKRAGSRYESGRRSGSWLKYKWSKEQEFVIGGFTPPQGGRMYFGALLVGYYRGGKLFFAGKVGTGFDERTLAMLHRKMGKLGQAACPFANLPEKLPAGSGSRGITPAIMRRCTWVTPELVCQVRFAEWTRDGHLRQPSFRGLREDKRAGEVVREG